jgi:hypothetical protein
MKKLLISLLMLSTATVFASECDTVVSKFKSKPFSNRNPRVPKSLIKILQAKGYNVVKTSPRFEITFGTSTEYSDIINLMPKNIDVRISALQDVRDAVFQGRNIVSVRYWELREDTRESLNDLALDIPTCEQLNGLIEQGKKIIRGRIENF